ncbi:PqqD family protein [Microbacterium sp. K41]|uniref:PqqD family protein n=1 Tax=Microbacterium sp. K41 TaxID=2305437 RepID=UPI00109C4863|nr:PqqD family protein [Microbacterium sp. K41]
MLLVPDEDPTVRDPQTWSKERALAMLVERSEALTALRTPLRTIAALLDAVGHPVVVRWSAAVSVDDVLDAVFDVAAPGGPIRVAPEVETAVIATASVRVGGIFRGPFLDALALPEGRTAVLSAHLGGAHLRILDRTESAVWHAADGAPLGELLMRVGRLTAGRQAGVSHAEAMTTLHAEGLLREEPSWSVRATAAWVAEDERTTVLDLAAGPSRLLALDGSAHWIWTILAERSSLTERDLVDECARLFGVAADSIAADVRGLLEQLRNEGLLRPT